MNTLWFFAISGEMALNYKTGLINRQGSPFAQARSVFPTMPKDKKKAIVWFYYLAARHSDLVKVSPQCAKLAEQFIGEGVELKGKELNYPIIEVKQS